MSNFIIRTVVSGWDAPDLMAWSVHNDITPEDKKRIEIDLLSKGIEVLEWFGDKKPQDVCDHHRVRLAREVNDSLHKGELQLPKLSELGSTSKRVLIVGVHNSNTYYQTMPLHIFLAYKEVGVSIRLATPDEYDKEYPDSLISIARCDRELVGPINKLLGRSRYQLIGW